MIDSLSWDDKKGGLRRSRIFGYDVIVFDRDIINFEYYVFSGL